MNNFGLIKKEVMVRPSVYLYDKNCKFGGNVLGVPYGCGFSGLSDCTRVECGFIVNSLCLIQVILF